MKVMVLCDVDEEKIKEICKDSKNNLMKSICNQFECMKMSGIYSKIIENMNNMGWINEYQAFVKSMETNQYIPTGRTFLNKRICEARFKERVDNGWNPSFFDVNDYKIRKRMAYSINTEWEDIN